MYFICSYINMNDTSAASQQTVATHQPDKTSQITWNLKEGLFYVHQFHSTHPNCTLIYALPKKNCTLMNSQLRIAPFKNVWPTWMCACRRFSFNVQQIFTPLPKEKIIFTFTPKKKYRFLHPVNPRQRLNFLNNFFFNFHFDKHMHH